MAAKKARNVIMLISAALIWGCAFVAQAVGMDYIGPLTFNCVRYFIGSLVLIPVILFIGHRNKNKPDYKGLNKTVIIGGIACGVIVFVASILQQFGLLYTTPGKAGFITSLYIVFIPIFGLFLKKKTSPLMYVGIVVAVIGLYLLCVTEDFSIELGDILILLCAVFFSFHIMTIDYFSPKVNGVILSSIQFFVAAVLCMISMFIFETPTLSGIFEARIALLYTGVLSCGVAYTFQILAQSGTNPVLASLLMSLESVFAVLADLVILHTTLTIKEIIGCVLVFSAVILAQLPSPAKKKGI